MSTAKPEYWVLRVWQDKHTGAAVRLDSMTITAKLAAMALVETGDLVLVPSPDGTVVAEPVEGYHEEAPAHALSERLARENPDKLYRVILSVDVTPQ